MGIATESTAESKSLESLWTALHEGVLPVRNTIVSARSFFPAALSTAGSLRDLIGEHNVWEADSLDTQFSSNGDEVEIDGNSYSHSAVVHRDKQLTDGFHASIPSIVAEHPRFIDQLRRIHFQNMRGNEDLMLYPSQTRRLQREGVDSIAGRIRTIQIGFGDFRFNAPTAEHLDFLLSVYTKKVEEMMGEATKDSIYDMVSFAQNYFAMLHPFYERCGRTSEELMYVLFEQVDRDSTLYISKTGWRENPVALERMDLLNQNAERFNKKIAACLGIDPDKVQKTPDVYEELTKRYFPERHEEIYSVQRDRPFYYSHPIPQVLHMYYFAMESLLFDEINDFSLNKPTEHIAALGSHLQEKGHKSYTFQRENRNPDFLKNAGKISS